MCAAFLTLLCSEGCLIMIGENSYRGLETSEMHQIEPFQSVLAHEAKDSGADITLYEITSTDIKEAARENPYTWVHIWRPWCPNELCQNIGIFQETSEKYADVALMMISQTYDFKEIQGIVNRSSFTLPVYVMKNEYYGHKLRKASEKLAADFDIEDVYLLGDDLIFKSDSLIYSGENGIGFVDSIFTAPSLKL